MKRLVFSLLFIVSILLSGAIVNSSFAQNDLKKEQKKEELSKVKVEAKVDKGNPNGFTKNWFIGVKGGATFFISPLKDNPFSWGTGVTLGKQLNRKVALRVDYLYGNLKSEGQFDKKYSDGSVYSNMLFADVDFMEIALLLKLNMNDFLYSKSPKYLRELYIFGGGAYTMYRSIITDKNNVFIAGSGYSSNGERQAMEGALAVPLGIGVTYKLGKNDIVNLNAEFGYRFVQSDDLDAGLSDETSQYTFTSLGLLFNLGRPSLSPQKITADAVKEELEASLNVKIDKDINDKVGSEIKPMKEKLAKQSVDIANNQEQLKVLQEEIEAQNNVTNKQSNETKMGDGHDVGGIDITSVYFAFNSTYITPAMEREIAVIAVMLKKNKKLKCDVIGNSSNVGSPEYNLQLSQKRAEAVMNLLIEEFKISEERLTLSNNGLVDPLAENIRRINRRVDLIIK